MLSLLSRRPTEVVAPIALTREEAHELHQALETLDDALGFATRVRARIDLLADRLVTMQTLAEEIADEPGSIDDRELAHAKIEILAEQADVIARKPVHEGVPALEGGVFRFPLRGLGLASLELEIPNLRARGEGSLGLYEHVDAMIALVQEGGRVLAGQEVPLRAAARDDDDASSDAASGASRLLPEGRYRVELTYHATDASEVRLRLLPAAGEAPLVELPRIDLSADTEAEEVDLGNGLALTIDRIAASDDVEIETVTVQGLEWRHERGERLDSVEGWFHETIQPRDFELYALFLEGPIEVVRRARTRVETFEEEARAALEGLLARAAGGRELREPLFARFAPGGPSWRAVDAEVLLEALAEDPSRPGAEATGAGARPTGRSDDPKNVARFYVHHLHATAGTPDLLARALEKAIADLGGEGGVDAFARRVGRVRRSLRFDVGPREVLAALSMELLAASREARAGEHEAAKARLQPLVRACLAARPGGPS